MKKLLPIALLLILFSGKDHPVEKISQRSVYENFINNHPYTTRERLTPEQLKAIPKKDRPDLAMEQDFLLTMDPALGRPAPERLHPVYQQIQAARQNPIQGTPGATNTPWVERGPNNVGGRTRAIMFDPNDATHKKVWAGGVTGGLWYNTDITNPASTWIAADDFWENISITAIAADPTNDSIFYVGTGEGWGSSVSGARGAGIWKSTDAGATWSQLSSTANFHFVNDLVVREENGMGVIYAGLRGVYYVNTIHGAAAEGLQRSTDGGQSFSQVLPNVPSQNFNYAVADLEVAADNRLWLGTINSANSGSNRGGGTILYSDNGTTWTTAYTKSGGRRVRIATAPSDSAYVYAIIEENYEVGEMVKTTDHGATWVNMSEPADADPNIPATDFSRNQAWVHLSLAVDPNDEHTVIAGGIDLFRSANGGNSWNQLCHWYGGFGFTEVHADQQIVAFRPGSSSEALFGNDGGIYRSTDLSSPVPTFSNLNRGYNVTQFYSCAIHPDIATDYFLGGTQDNGSQQFNTSGMNSTFEVSGGDGSYCFIDQTNPQIQITSYVYNSYWRSTDGGLTFFDRIQNTSSTGSFINPADYDDNLHILYSAKTSNSINRILDVDAIPDVTTLNAPLGSMATHLRVSPYTTTSTTLFVGTAAGRVFKIENAESNSPVSTNLTKTNLPTGSVSCIEIGSSQNELLVTYSNYGVNSVWYTNDGGNTWTSKEGNLPDMPIRWALFNPNNTNEAILATEVGVWNCTDLSASTPTWSPSTSGLANVRTSMLQMRNSDNEVIAATFGRGIFSSSGFQSTEPPQASFISSSNFACGNDTLAFTDISNSSPTSWQWSFVPNTVTFVNGTNSTSRHPQVTFDQSGAYDIILQATNAFGTDVDSMQITAEVFPAPNISANGNVLTCTPSSGFSYQWYFNGAPIAGATGSQHTSAQDGYYQVEMTGTSCTLPSNPYLLIHFDLEESVAELDLKIYPNPVSEFLSLSFHNAEMTTSSLKLISANGAQVYQKSLPTARMINEQISLRHLPAGAYVLKLKIGSQEFARNIQKL